MMLRKRFLKAVSMVITAWHAQLCNAQEQYVLDTVSQGTGVIWPANTTATTDGGTILNLWAELGEVKLQWKMDQAGAPSWCKQYGISGERSARMPDGGIVFCEITGLLTQGDTTYNYLQVVRTDAEGGVIWSKLVTIHDPFNSFFNNLWLYIASDEDGNFLITMSELQGNAYQWFYCLDGDGELLWSRNFLFNVNADHVQHVCSDGFGGWYFGSYRLDMSVFRLGHLNFLGEMTWYNSYAVPTPQEFWLGGLCSLGFAPVAVGGYEAVFDEDYRWFVMRLNLNGTLDWFRVSATTEELLSRCGATSGGELLVSSGIQSYPANYLARLSATGEVLNSFRPTTHTVDGTSYASWFLDWDQLNTTLTMGNMLVTNSDSSSEPSYQPAVWRLPIADLSACGAEANELSSVPLSNSAVAVQDQPYSEVLVPITITDTLCTVTSYNPVGVSDYCYYFMGEASVPQPLSAVTVLSTLLARGTPLSVTSPGEAFTIEVLDTHGRLLYRGRLAPHATGFIPTSGWTSGLYFVRSQPVNDGRTSVVKVMIE